MAELIDESSNLESTTVAVTRTSATIKGGRRFSFNALVVVGDRRGQVGLGYAKANEVPPAIEKAQKEGRKKMKRIVLHGRTIPHEVEGAFGATKVRLIPASPGTGVVAGGAVRAVLELAGVTDCLSKVYGSSNKSNVVKATISGLLQCAPKEVIAGLRGVTIERSVVDDMIERSGVKLSDLQAPPRPRRDPRDEQRGGRGKGGGGGGRGGPRRGRPGAPAEESGPAPQ